MSRLTDLIAQAKRKDPQLGADLDKEFRVLSSRLPFGLNFERHSPEAVELPLRPIRKGDKVRVLPPRGETKRGDQRLWQVKAIHKATKVADLELLGVDEPESQSVSLNDLVVVAEFRDVIHPGLVSTGKVTRGGDKPFHTVINGENYHVLKALTYTHRGKVDAIYIDPPYNTGAKDWKYNNDYVEGDDLYRHSKWLAFMERRLLLAKELLNPEDSVLIVTIDEKEYLRLGLLLEQVFPEATRQMVSSMINPKGTGRANEFRRVDEYIFFVWFGGAKLGRLDRDSSVTKDLGWQTFRRRDLGSARGTTKGGPRQFYPIYVNTSTNQIEAFGEALPHAAPRESAPEREGCIAVFPIRPDGTEMNWGAIASSAEQRWRAGYMRAGSFTPDEPQKYQIQYLKSGPIEAIRRGEAVITGRAQDGSVIGHFAGDPGKIPTTQWAYPSHVAEHYGTVLIREMLGGRPFPFPKALYAVEDALRLFLDTKRNAVVLDFFSGSGTTAHALMRLNKQDGGCRQCISVTNNEVGASEQKTLREKGLRPGDVEWEQWGICDYITKPRVQAAITGRTPGGAPIKGDYKFIDEFPMADGLEENAEFFTLTYEAEKSVSHNLAYARIAPLLWLRAGARGKRIDKLPAEGWAVADAYGLLAEVDKATPFIKALGSVDARVAFIVTDDDRRFQSVAKRLPKGVESVRLYESYLTNFSFSNGE